MCSGHPPDQGKRQEENMTNTSLRAVSLHFAAALAVAGTIASGVGPARAATHPPMLASESGWPNELVNRPGCGSERDYETRPACEAVRR
jgi:hypothetical protein